MVILLVDNSFVVFHSKRGNVVNVKEIRCNYDEKSLNFIFTIHGKIDLIKTFVRSLIDYK